MSREFWIGPPEHNRIEDRITVYLEQGDLRPPPDRSKSKIQAKNGEEEPFLLVGFDTEFKTPSYSLTREEIVAGMATSLILSYQFYAKCSDGRVWSGICCPENGERLELSEFMLFVLGTGARQHGYTGLPRKVYLVGHFTRADIPAFADFQKISFFLNALRNTFVNTDSAVPITLPCGGDVESLKVLVRDTMLLSPQSSRSLKELGKLVGVPKVELSSDSSVYKSMIRNMDRVRSEQWELFKRYALTDAEICVLYIEQVMKEYREVTSKTNVPVTLTAIGVTLLESRWLAMGMSRLAVLGREQVSIQYFDKKKGYYISQKTEVPLPLVHYHTALATDCYHGGRNEQFWFGPGFEDDWSDFDLSSAYPTAMSLIGLPDWKNIRQSTKVSDYTASTLGYALVEFEFPKHVRYPTLPVRTSNGLIFPLSGVSECPAPEIYLARKLGAKLKIRHGVVVNTDPTISVFTPFIQECLKRRIDAGKTTLRGLFWKEISNSTYGKTAQGLKERRVYDMRERDTMLLPESSITNAYFAAFITSFVRATLGEIINSIPANKMVFSCTTDGFLANLTDDETTACTTGEFCELFRQQRRLIAGEDSVLEKKHYIRKPLGWRTRGQASLVVGVPRDELNHKHVLLARGGVSLAPEFEEPEDQNDEIVNLFFGRTPESRIHIEAKTGLRDMVEHGADFVDKSITKRLSMEFDWKRRPHACKESTVYNHLVFSTQPWHSVEQFIRLREVIDDYQKGSPKCFKTVDDLKTVSSFVETMTASDDESMRYLRRKEGDIRRLRQMLCAAFKNKKCGLDVYVMSNAKFATILTENGIKCSKADVENGLRIAFIPNHVPSTQNVLKALKSLMKVFPAINQSVLLYEPGPTGRMIKLFSQSPCQFVSRVE